MSDATLTIIVAGVVQVFSMVVGFLTLWLRVKYGTEKKIDDNTAITEQGAKAAVYNAIEARTAAKDAKTAARDAVEVIEKKLNGGIDSAVMSALAPMRAAMEEHAAKDERALVEIDVKFKDLVEYIHQRNHDILGAINAQSIPVQTLLKRLEEPK